MIAEGWLDSEAGKTARRIAAVMASVGVSIAAFVLADAAMPDSVKWWMRWVMAGMALVSYLAGAALGAFFMREWLNVRAAESSADKYEEEKERAELVARLEAERERGVEERARRDAEIKQRDEELKSLRNLLGAERTLSSAYKEKLARAEERLRRYEDDDEKKASKGRAMEERRCVAFREEMPFKGKELLASLMYGGPRDVSGVEADAMRSYFGDEAFGYVIVEEVGLGTVRVSLRDGSREFFERHQELLEDARKALPDQP